MLKSDGIHLSVRDYYSPKTLNKTSITNEDGTTLVTFKDFQGFTILERLVDNQINLDTYYIYDDFGRLGWVISPEGVAALQASGKTTLTAEDGIAKDYCYIYRYDGRGRVIERKLPGKDADYMVYDKADRLVLSQDGNHRKNSEWSYFVYDNLNRIIEQSIVSTNLTRNEIQTKYSSPSFDNTYPTLGGSYTITKPLSGNDFTLVKHLGSTRYGGSTYTSKKIIERSEYIPISDVHILVVCNELVTDPCDDFAKTLHTLPWFEGYIMPDGTVNPLFEAKAGNLTWEEYMGNPGICGYYVPEKLLEAVVMSVPVVVSKPPYFEIVFEDREITPYRYILDGSGGYQSDYIFYDFYPQENYVYIPLEAEIQTVYEKFAIPSRLNYLHVDEFDTNPDSRTTGLKVYEKVAVMGDVEDKFVERAYYYDYKGRTIQVVEKGHRGGISRISTKYDFVGNILALHESHTISINAPEDVKMTHFSYDHRNRLLSETTTLNDGDPAVVTYGYAELGQLASKSYGTDNDAITDTLTYNIQGWMTRQKNDLFDMELRYYDPKQADTKASYTGNITEWDWQHKGREANTYAFDYDNLSRLKDTKQYIDGFNDNLFVERGLAYDKNGNILSLDRYSGGQCIESFGYEYNGNQIQYLNNDDNSYDYVYDTNGNMTKDGLKELDLTYNLLNLIDEVHDSNTGDLKAKYTWVTDGSKAGVIDGDGKNGFEYLGSLVYKRVNGELKLESAPFGGGRIVADGNGYTPNYFITDHLGSTRVIIDGSNGDIKDASNYYPLGGRWDDYGSVVSDNRYRYNGKEDQASMGVNYLDYGARMYDSRLGRWHSIDPLAEKYYSWSPYNYVMNNPLKFVDPDGRDVWEFDDLGEIINRIKDRTQDTFHMVDGDGARMDGKSISFGYGTVESQKSHTFSPDGENMSSYDVYKVRGDDNAKQLFEFMADNTSVEWGHAKTGVEGDKGLNFITTSHEKINERGLSRLIEGQLIKGYTMRELNHSHPGNTAYPSGLDKGNSDIGFATTITNYYKSRWLNVPKFNIYLPGRKSYIPFNPNSKIEDYDK